MKRIVLFMSVAAGCATVARADCNRECAPEARDPYGCCPAAKPAPTPAERPSWKARRAQKKSEGEKSAALVLMTDEPCSVSIDGEPALELPRDGILKVPVKPGEHALVARRAGGGVFKHLVTVAENAQSVVTIVFPAGPAAQPAAGTPPEPAAEIPAKPAAPSPSPVSAPSPAPAPAPVSAPASAQPATDARGVTWVRIPAGTFLRGCVPADPNCDVDEKPRHPVTLSRDYWLMEKEATVTQFLAFCAAAKRAAPKQPDFNKPHHPVVEITWGDADAYCRWLGGRLPTEAEWERAARGGSEGHLYPWGDQITEAQANYCHSMFFKHQTRPPGSYLPNEYGLHDLIGNVAEWTQDWYGETAYGAGAVTDPAGPATGTLRTLRGGSWWLLPNCDMRVSNRGKNEPNDASKHIGVRCARDTAP